MRGLRAQPDDTGWAVHGVIPDVFRLPHAIATARHLPRIAYLFQALEQLRAAVDAAVWRADWAGHHARVSDLVGRHTDPSRWSGLLATLGERERDLVDRMLARRLDS